MDSPARRVSWSYSWPLVIGRWSECASPRRWPSLKPQTASRCLARPQYGGQRGLRPGAGEGAWGWRGDGGRAAGLRAGRGHSPRDSSCPPGALLSSPAPGARPCAGSLSGPPRPLPGSGKVLRARCPGRGSETGRAYFYRVHVEARDLPVTKAYWVHLVHTAALGMGSPATLGVTRSVLCAQGWAGAGPRKGPKPPVLRAWRASWELTPSLQPFLNHCPPAWANPHLSQTFKIEVIADSRAV